MSILERVTRAIDRYHLLPRLISALSYISFILAVVGTGWIFILPQSGQYRNTYISENALMPSQAYSFYRESEWNFLRGYRDALVEMKNDTISAKNDALQSWFNDLGYKTSRHSFQNIDGTTGDNLYAILHTPRADSESILLSAPWITSTNETNIGGISLAISLAKYFGRLNVWSKNIIVVIPMDAKFALRSWVEAYHTKLDNTGGSIESAVVLEFPSESDGLHHIELEYDGLNGQLPNLDLINCAVFVGEHEGFKIALQKKAHYVNNYINRLEILLLGIKNLATTGITSNGCETFSGWNIQALTLRAVGDEGYDITTFGRVVEGIFRSVNNLLEKFHQSFFYYLMLAPRHFVSIGTYLPSAVLLSVSFGIASLNSFLNNGGIPYPALIKEVKPTFIIFGSVLLSTVGVGVFLQSYYRNLSEFSAAAFVQFNLSLSLLPVLNVNRVLGFNKVLRYVLQSWSYMYLTMILVSLLVVHFTLAFGIGVFSIPLLLIKIEYFANSKYRRVKHVLNSLALGASNPFTALLIIAYLDNLSTYEILVNLLSSWSQLQCWTWFIVIIGWYPSWFCLMLSSI